MKRVTILGLKITALGLLLLWFRMWCHRDYFFVGGTKKIFIKNPVSFILTVIVFFFFSLLPARNFYSYIKFISLKNKIKQKIPKQNKIKDRI